jgi:predicted nucleotidyltransferase
MFLSKKQIGVIDVFRKDIFTRLPIVKIAGILNSNYPKTHEAVQILVSKGILAVELIGTSKICSLNLNDKTISLISYLDEQEALGKSAPNVDKLLLLPELEEDIVIITGSYSTGKNTSKSDIDIAVITPSDAYKKQKLLENVTALYSPEMHIIVFTPSNFKEMLLSKSENFGKEVFRKHLILRNADNYYRLIRGIIDNGIDV